MRWKLLGLAGLAGVAATGVVLVRKRRAHRDYSPAELRERLHQRLADAQSTHGEPVVGAHDEAASTVDGHGEL